MNNNKLIGITRRQLIKLLGLGLGASQLAGCPWVKRPVAVCPFDPKYSSSTSPLTIDVHAHIFNATDLQVKEFVKRVATRQGGGMGRLAQFFGGVLQTIAWQASPTVAEEAAILARLKPAIIQCDESANLASLNQLREQKYQQGVAELQQEAANRLPALGLSSGDLTGDLLDLSDESQGFREIFELPDSYQSLQHEPPPAIGSLSELDFRRTTLKSALRFVVEMFQYRFVSVYNYLNAYSNGSRKIDLMTPALVDYDWWLAEGRPTPSSLPEQVRLMREISILSGGRVHPMVPFDPYRQAVHDSGGDVGRQSGFSPIDLVKQAIEEEGAVGVKLYPPMGFAPFGNKRLDVWQDKSWLTPIATDPAFPQKLDDSLRQLYEYCAIMQVPVMGHSNQSNGPDDELEALTGPSYWAEAAAGFPDTSLSFAHFGGVGNQAEPGESEVIGFLNQLVTDQQSERKQLHADASYFSNLLDRPSALTNALEELFRYGPPGSNAAVDRLMYGSDWKMLAAELGATTYLAGFENVIAQVENRLPADSHLSKKFFGQNAADFLQLRRGQQNRRRLENFYDRHNMRAPDWVAKVDEQT